MLSDNGRTSRYVYDAAGERILKRGPQGQTAYINQYFTVRNGAIATKHVFIGSTRLASKLSPGSAHIQPDDSGTPATPTAPSGSAFPGNPNQNAQNALRNPHFNSRFNGNHPGRGRVNRSDTANEHAQDVNKNPHLVDQPPPPPPPVPGDPPGDEPPAGLPDSNFLYYYHPDHLGSSSYVTDTDGELYEHVQYFPFGETWVDQRSESQRVPYLFTGKELDEDTGLYYFGARYYDPRTSVWQSADPIIEKYLDGAVGGTTQPVNFALYTYARNNPLAYTDPDGNIIFLAAVPFIVKGASAALALYGAYETGHAIGTAGRDLYTGERTGGEVATQAAIDVGTSAALAVTGLGALKVADKVIPDSVKKKAADAIGSVADRINNPVPGTLARVVPDNPVTRASGTLGRPDADDVFVTAADDIRGLNAKQIAERLAIPESSSGFRVIEFPTPKSGIASPVNRTDPGFVGGGRTAGGAREFVVPNGEIPTDAITRTEL